MTVQFTNIHAFAPSLCTDKQGTLSHSLSGVYFRLEVFLSLSACLCLALEQCASDQAQSIQDLRGELWRSGARDLNSASLHPWNGTGELPN